MRGLSSPKPKVPNSGQKGKTVKYVRAYLAEEEEAEEIGVWEWDWDSEKERDREREREREREETDFGCKGCSQNAAFQVRIFTIFFPLLAVSRTRTTRARQANLRVRAFLFMVNCVITP